MVWIRHKKEWRYTLDECAWVQHKKEWRYLRGGYVRPASGQRWGAFVYTPDGGFAYLGVFRQRKPAMAVVEAATALGE